MTDNRQSQQEDISALIDGALQGAEATHALAELLRGDEALATWHRYHLIGDVMRSQELAPAGFELRFAHRVMDCIATEAVSPHVTNASANANANANAAIATPWAPAPMNQSPANAANHAPSRSVWRRALAGGIGAAACLLLVLGSEPLRDALTTHQAPQAVAQVPSAGSPMAAEMKAQNIPSQNTPAQEVALDDRPVMARDPELDALLSAHQQMGGHSALQAPSGFMRNATFARPKP